MRAARARLYLVVAAAAWIAAAAVSTAQETLTYAKNLYNLAAYDEALVVLDRLHETASGPESSEIAGYQAFCLLALGRTDDARQAIATLVQSDPLYRPPDATTSPRMRGIFDEVRQALLPGIVHGLYDRAKAAFDRNEPALASTEFERLLALLDEPALANVSDAADLRRLATGFRDLAKTAIATAAAPPKPQAPTVTAAAPSLATTETPPPAPVVFTAGDQDVVPPVSVSRATPPWHPQNEIEKLREFRGLLEIVVDEQGGVVSVTLAKSVHPKYDARLLESARAWTFRPATKNGVAVRYLTTIEVRLGPSGS